MLNTTIKTSNLQPINITLVDILKCNDISEDGYVNDFNSCSEFIIDRYHINNDTLPTPLLPNQEYNLDIEDKVNDRNNISLSLELNFQKNIPDYVNYPLVLKMQYPWDWEVVDGINEVRLCSPPENDYDKYQIIFIYRRNNR